MSQKEQDEIFGPMHMGGVSTCYGCEICNPDDEAEFIGIRNFVSGDLDDPFTCRLVENEILEL